MIDREVVAVAEDVAWLSADERAGWLAVAALMVRLPAVLDAQLRKDSGITHFEYMVMSMLSEQPGRTLQMSELAELTSSSLSRLSHSAARLQTAGYLVRTSLPGVGRRTNATLTDDGYAKVVEAAPGHVAAVRAYLVDAVTPEQLAVLRDVGSRVLRAIDPADACLEAVGGRLRSQTA